MIARRLRNGVLAGAIGSLICGYCLFRELPMPVETGPAYQPLEHKPYSQHPNVHFLTKAPHSIGIIGAGLAGLETAKALSQQGFHVEVLEKEQRVGGVWADNYDGAGLQGTFPHFHIPDFPWPAGTSLFPKLPEVRAYLESYVAAFHLQPLLSFNSEVTSVSQEKDDTWTVSLSNGHKNHYDFLILCTGPFYNPSIPAIPGLSTFQGTSLHSSQVRDSKLLFSGKRVVVVGGGKSACDILSLASESSVSVTGVMKELAWSGNRVKPCYGRNVMAWMTCRLAGILNPPPSDRDSWPNWALKQVGRLYYGLIEHALVRDIPEIIRPKSSLMAARVIIGRDEVLFARISKGEVGIVKGTISHITPQGLVVSDSLIPADILVFATGFKPVSFGLTGENDAFWLYRGVINPNIRNFAVIGYGNGTYTHVRCSLQAAWLCDVLRGAVILPDTSSMIAEIEQIKSVLQGKYGKNACNFAYVINEMRYYDALLRDMQIQTRRKATLWEDMVGLPDPQDYKLVLTHRV